MYEKWLDILNTVPLFDKMDKDEIRALLQCIKPQILNYKKGEYLIIENDECKGPGIVLEGEVLVSKENAAGERVILSKLGVGELFGEIFAFSGTSIWYASVSAVTDCTVMFLSAARMTDNCANQCINHKQLIQNMLHIVAGKALDLNKRVDYLTIKSIRSKISTYLLEKYEQTQQTYFVTPMKRNELADFLNVARPSLSRELMKMKEEGLIDFYRSSFKINDLEALKSYI